jgi:hypothetical protein
LKPGSARIDSASALFITTADERWGQTLRRAGAFDAQHLQDALPAVAEVVSARQGGGAGDGNRTHVTRPALHI